MKLPRRSAEPPSRAFRLMILCFALSAVLRAAEVAPAAAEQARADTITEAGCVAGSDDALLTAIRERGEELDRREREVEERLALLAVAEREYEARRADLLAAEQRLAETMALADTAAEEDIARLTQIYENVKPKRAASIFDTMDSKFAAGILGRMSPPAAAEILTLMDTDKAYAVSVILAARNMNAGTAPAPDFREF